MPGYSTFIHDSSSDFAWNICRNKLIKTDSFGSFQLCGFTHGFICFMVIFEPLDDIHKVVHSGYRCQIHAQEFEQVRAERKHTWKEGRNYNPEFLKWSNIYDILFIKRTQKLKWRIFLTLMINGSSGLFMESASTLKDELVTTSRL